MVHDNGAPQRAMVPGAFQNQARNMAPQHRGPHPGSGGQYPNYNDNMYSMEQQHSMTRANMSIDPSMQGWPGSGSAYPQMQRHYNQMAQPGTYRQHIPPQYSHQQDQSGVMNQKLQQQQHFSNQQSMIGNIGVPHQAMQPGGTGSVYQHMVGQQQHYQQGNSVTMYQTSPGYPGFASAIHQQQQ